MHYSKCFISFISDVIFRVSRYQINKKRRNRRRFQTPVSDSLKCYLAIAFAIYLRTFLTTTAPLLRVIF